MGARQREMLHTNQRSAPGYTLASAFLRQYRNAGRVGRNGFENRNHWKMTAKVTVADVERVAELANLELKPEETRNMLHDLNAILDHVAQLNELDTSGVAPLAQVSELEGTTGASTLREDKVLPSLERAKVMSQAPETDGSFFKVPKVIERA
jgi:aspartyl-tRNA(Asn)/glutamyl-tRNA(Gln) amidotransferase subunit C